MKLTFIILSDNFRFCDLALLSVQLYFCSDRNPCVVCLCVLSVQLILFVSGVLIYQKYVYCIVLF